jgi:probable rRNA maturation factor
MITFSLISESKHWPARIKRITGLVNKILFYKRALKFDNKINYHCNIILTNNKMIKKINFKFRKKNYSTDVLTFVSQLDIVKRKKKKICDIFLSAEIIKKDSKINKIDFYSHLTHLLIHSFLHINGFDHKNKIAFNKMKNLEINILNKLKINNPYLQN